ncbi:hypothetical protein AAHA92_24937 [Salvia divinorum]|uniref:Tf2-1-like SH3-like domain-containing protein n=1 Tax=Salvia divinorum TaxID=28513 RepID=A0ABD1GBK4_SALDI
MSPFEMVYGRTPPVVIPYELGSSMVQEVDVALRTRDEILQELEVNLELARQQQKSQGKHRRDEEFKEGDMVYLRLRPYRQQSVYHRVYQKLASRYFRPYKVLRRIGKVAYELQLPENCRVHPIFHVSLLRRRVGSAEVVPMSLPPLTEQEESNVEPKWAQRAILIRGVPQREVLIKRKYLLEDDSTWEIADEIKKRFPDFKLEDKLSLLEGENDEPDLLGLTEPPVVRRRSCTTKPNWKLQQQRG